MDSILKISEGANLAIHAITLLAVAQGRGQLKISDLSEKLDASAPHLGKVMNRLARAKYVVSKRGPGGGFVLGPRARGATMLDIFELMDGPMNESACLLGLDACPVGGCVLGDAIQNLGSYVRQTLAGIKIEDIGKTKKMGIEVTNTSSARKNERKK
jgi:Rrf2 family protein